MKQAKQAEPPSWFRPPVFTVGQNRRGNWVVRDQKGVCGGLFVTGDAALRFVRADWISVTSGGHGFGESRTGHDRRPRHAVPP